MNELIRWKERLMRKLQRVVVVMLYAAVLSVFAGCASPPQNESTGEYINDAGITTKVKTALFAESELKGMPVSVETYRGVVQLSGFVNAEDDIRRAGEIASGVTGVKSVINNLAVKPPR
jgi:osmotically-inducible protein OsmY